MEGGGKTWAENDPRPFLSSIHLLSGYYLRARTVLTSEDRERISQTEMPTTVLVGEADSGP